MFLIYILVHRQIISPQNQIIYPQFHCVLYIAYIHIQYRQTYFTANQVDFIFGIYILQATTDIFPLFLTEISMIWQRQVIFRAKTIRFTHRSPTIQLVLYGRGTLKCVLAQDAMRVVHLGQNVVERPCKIYVYKSNRLEVYNRLENVDVMRSKIAWIYNCVVDA